MTDGNVVRSDAPGGLSRRTLVAGAAWSVPVVVGLSAVPAEAASVSVSLSNRNLELKPKGLNVHVGINNDNNTAANVTVTITLTAAGQASEQKVLVLSVPAHAYKDANVVFSPLPVGVTYYGSIKVTGAGVVPITTVTDPASLIVTQSG